ncbi:NDP-sugar synthase [Corynebacterium pseudodiphtheriticum]|uniref:NDP-sugar synthase n=1 Tax=Corynebacterium pseudodiphtheriticum TaxID=37637 RepID=UPI00234D8A11|nr:NDP-sugar synthase [Corynebacterium pseudodiphtheriticum]MDC7068670.1 NDP-sugar synthase [Corynebacterium pseudodiphtheriticum]MDC7084736.1 NDP-sugar synthase [Corynebacterium pseudodiphtheriticum]MDC7086787.1 NDP-sugar synthase [Corynebacterium pseudodiphtheriticum]
MSNTDAVILVGGRGTRLRPLTINTPKPMLPTAGYPFLQHILARIKAAGINHVILSTSFRAEVFEEYFGDGSELGLEIEYVVEEEALGTGGGIRNVYDKLRGDNVMVFNGDVLAATDLRGILRTHEEKNADLTMHLVRVSDPRAFGCVPTDVNGQVTAFLEKTEDPPTDQINAGCYVFKKDLITSIPAGRNVSVERETFPRLLDEGRSVVGHVDAAYWRDMGRPDDFVQGSSDLVRGIVGSPLLEGRTGEALVDPAAGVAGGVLLLGGTTVGRGAEIGGGCRIDSSVIFAGATIEPGARIRNSIIADGAHIGANAIVDGCVIGEGAQIGARCELAPGMRVWPGVIIPDTGIRFSSDA